eukprot:966027_1
MASDINLCEMRRSLVFYYCVEIASGTSILTMCRYVYGLAWIGFCCGCHVGFALHAYGIPSTHSHFRIIWVPVYTTIGSHYWQNHIASILMRYSRIDFFVDLRFIWRPISRIQGIEL